MISNPCGVCIQLLEARIQVAEISVPSATMMVAKKCKVGPTLLQPNSATPRNPASRKKAVSTSYASSGPVTPPAKADTTSAAAANKGPSEEAKALAEVLRQRYPDRLTPEELKSVTNDFDGDLAGIKALREKKLANGDEPDITFHA